MRQELLRAGATVEDSRGNALDASKIGRMVLDVKKLGSIPIYNYDDKDGSYTSEASRRSCG